MLVKLLIFPLFYNPGSGSTDPNECRSERIHITALEAFVVVDALLRGRLLVGQDVDLDALH